MQTLNRLAATALLASMALGVWTPAMAASTPAGGADESAIQVIGGCSLHIFRCFHNVVTIVFSPGARPTINAPIVLAVPPPPPMSAPPAPPPTVAPSAAFPAPSTPSSAPAPEPEVRAPTQ